MKNKAILFILFAFSACGIAQAQSDNSVEVVYNGTSATVNVADNISHYLTVTQQGAHVSIAQSDSVASEITYTLSGTSTDGEFYMSGSYKATVELNGLTLTNATPVYSGAAVHIQNGKRINVKVITGTTNTLVDAASGSQKGCLYVKGHAEFKQQGTINVVGNVKHAIKAGEYISLKNATLNITSAVGDGISCNQFFLMQSGTVNISGTDDDGIQCDLEGDTATASAPADDQPTATASEGKTAREVSPLLEAVADLLQTIGNALQEAARFEGVTIPAATLERWKQEATDGTKTAAARLAEVCACLASLTPDSRRDFDALGAIFWSLAEQMRTATDRADLLNGYEFARAQLFDLIDRTQTENQARAVREANDPDTPDPFRKAA